VLECVAHGSPTPRYSHTTFSAFRTKHCLYYLLFPVKTSKYNLTEIKDILSCGYWRRRADIKGIDVPSLSRPQCVGGPGSYLVQWMSLARLTTGRISNHKNFAPITPSQNYILPSSPLPSSPAWDEYGRMIVGSRWIWRVKVNLVRFTWKDGHSTAVCLCFLLRLASIIWLKYELLGCFRFCWIALGSVDGLASIKGLVLKTDTKFYEQFCLFATYCWPSGPLLFLINEITM